MPMTEAKKRNNKKYDKSHTKVITMKLNLSTDSDILEKIKQHDNVQGYIKKLIRADIKASPSELKGDPRKAHIIRRIDYSGKCENLYEIRFESYSGYTKTYSAVWRDIYAESEEDAIAWANEYAESYNREAKAKGWEGNKMRYESLRPIKELPRPEDYPTMAEVEHELMLEGYPIQD